MGERQKYKIRDLMREVEMLRRKIELAARVIEYLDNPAVLLAIPQPHRMRLSELLDGGEKHD